MRAALLDVQTGTWARLPDSDGGGHVRTWTGKRFVSVDTNLDGDEADLPGVTYPRGVALDLAARAWPTLKNAPEKYQQGWTLQAVTGGRIVTGGYLYDDERAEWTLLRRPDGAALQGPVAVWASNPAHHLGGFDPSGGYTAAGLSNKAFMHDHGEKVKATNDPYSGPPGQRCPARPTPDVRFNLEIDGQPVTSGDKAVPAIAGQPLSIALTASAPAGTELARLVVGDADASWGLGPDGPTGLDQVLIEALDIGSDIFSQRSPGRPRA